MEGPYINPEIPDTRWTLATASAAPPDVQPLRCSNKEGIITNLPFAEGDEIAVEHWNDRPEDVRCYDKHALATWARQSGRNPMTRDRFTAAQMHTITGGVPQQPPPQQQSSNEGDGLDMDGEEVERDEFDTSDDEDDAPMQPPNQSSIQSFGILNDLSLEADIVSTQLPQNHSFWQNLIIIHGGRGPQNMYHMFIPSNPQTRGMSPEQLAGYVQEHRLDEQRTNWPDGHRAVITLGTRATVQNEFMLAVIARIIAPPNVLVRVDFFSFANNTPEQQYTINYIGHVFQ